MECHDWHSVARPVAESQLHSVTTNPPLRFASDPAPNHLLNRRIPHLATARNAKSLLIFMYRA